MLARHLHRVLRRKGDQAEAEALEDLHRRQIAERIALTTETDHQAEREALDDRAGDDERLQHSDPADDEAGNRRRNDADEAAASERRRATAHLFSAFNRVAETMLCPAATRYHVKR